MFVLMKGVLPPCIEIWYLFNEIIGYRVKTLWSVVAETLNEYEWPLSSINATTVEKDSGLVWQNDILRGIDATVYCKVFVWGNSTFNGIFFVLTGNSALRDAWMKQKLMTSIVTEDVMLHGTIGRQT